MFPSPLAKIPDTLVSIVTGVCVPGKQFYILKAMWSSCKVIFRKKRRKTNNSEMGRFSTFSFSVSFFGSDTGIWDSKGPLLGQWGFTCLFHLAMDMFFLIASRGIICRIAFIIKDFTVKWINGKKFKEVTKMIKGWESMTSEERGQEHTIYSLPKGI